MKWSRNRHSGCHSFFKVWLCAKRLEWLFRHNDHSIHPLSYKSVMASRVRNWHSGFGVEPFFIGHIIFLIFYISIFDYSLAIIHTFLY